MAGIERDLSELVQVKIRCRERLRLQLEAEAEKSGHNLTSEIVRRLERSLADEAREKSAAEMQGGWKTARLCAEITKAVQFFGVDCSSDEEPLMRAVLTGAITQILSERLSGWAGLMGAPTSEPRGPELVVSLSPELEERGRARGAMIGHHITLATRAAEAERHEDFIARAAEPAGETLLRSAVRMGLVDASAKGEHLPREPIKNSKNDKKQD